jgi:hypothetical protein
MFAATALKIKTGKRSSCAGTEDYEREMKITSGNENCERETRTGVCEDWDILVIFAEGI